MLECIFQVKLHTAVMECIFSIAVNMCPNALCGPWESCQEPVCFLAR